jgi:hypothetical protein
MTSRTLTLLHALVEDAGRMTPAAGASVTTMAAEHDTKRARPRAGAETPGPGMPANGGGSPGPSRLEPSTGEASGVNES